MTDATDPTLSVAFIIENCVGCKWTLHILAQVRAGVCRPGQLERSAEGLTAKVLSERLQKLTRFGILEKRSFPEIPPRVEYSLTPFGERLMDILDQVELLQRERKGSVGGQASHAEPDAAADPAS
jgi:DNA-binding HxlR family transcriptional regulator